jgi:hypothetical protein
MAAIESGRGGAGAVASATRAVPAEAATAEAEAVVPRVARTRATPVASTRNRLGIADLPVARNGTLVRE